MKSADKSIMRTPASSSLGTLRIATAWGVAKNTTSHSASAGSLGSEKSRSIKGTDSSGLIHTDFTNEKTRHYH